MKNLSECSHTFSTAVLARQDELNCCTTVWQIKYLIEDILEKDSNLRSEAKEYGKTVIAKMLNIRTYQKALQYLWNIILAGDSQGCFWTDEAANRKRGAKWK